MIYLQDMGHEIFFADAKRRFKAADLRRELDAISRSPRELMFYGPHQRATVFEADETRYAIEPTGLLDGTLSMTELRAILVVHNEVRVLAKMSHERFSGIGEVREILGLSGDELPFEVLEGMADFVRDLSRVAYIREKLALDEPRPTGTQMQDKNIQFWWDHFVGPIEEDGSFLGQAVAAELVEVIKGLASRNVVDNEGIIRWVNRGRGAELAAALYLNCLAEAEGL